MSFKWGEDTTPFSVCGGAQPCRFVLRQVDDDQFELAEPFVFTFKRPNDECDFIVSAALLGDTDLASVPSFLGWFARRHGRHTPAALLHDQLITDHPERLPAEQRMPPSDADRLFLRVLRECDVPLIKSWVLWTGVVLRTRWASRPWPASAVVAWFVAALAGTTLLVYGLATGRPLAVVVALLAPVLAAPLWGRQFQAGVVAGYSFWLVILGSAPAWLAYQIYRLAEYAALGVGRLRPSSAADSADATRGLQQAITRAVLREAFCCFSAPELIERGPEVSGRPLKGETLVSVVARASALDRNESTRPAPGPLIRRATSVALIGRMIGRATETASTETRRRSECSDAEGTFGGVPYRVSQSGDAFVRQIGRPV